MTAAYQELEQRFRRMAALEEAAGYVALHGLHTVLFRPCPIGGMVFALVVAEASVGTSRRQLNRGLEMTFGTLRGVLLVGGCVTPRVLQPGSGGVGSGNSVAAFFGGFIC